MTKHHQSSIQKVIARITYVAEGIIAKWLPTTISSVLNTLVGLLFILIPLGTASASALTDNSNNKIQNTANYNLHSNIDNLRFSHLLAQDTERLNANGTLKYITQDRVGYMWFVFRQGIARYDANQLQHYEIDANGAQPISPSSFVKPIEDKNGVVWIGGHGGLAFYTRDTDRFVQVTTSNMPWQLPAATVTALAVDASNRLFVGTDKGLAVVSADRSAVQFYSNALSGLGSSIIRQLFIAPNQNVWLGSSQSGLHLFDPQSTQFKHWHIDLGPASNPADDDIVQVLEDFEGEIWAGTLSMGLAKMEKDFTTFRLFKRDGLGGSLKSNSIRAIYEDQENNLWIATDHGGLSRFDRSTGKFITQEFSAYNPSGLSSNQLRDVFQDRDGNLWVAAFPNGINFYDRRKSRFTVYNHQNNDSSGLISNSILSIHEDKTGTLWIGSEGGLSELNPLNKKIINHSANPADPNALQFNAITSIIEDAQGYLWASSWSGGLHRFDRNTGQFKNYKPSNTQPNSLPSPYPWQLALNKQGELWISFIERGGIARYRSNTDDFDNIPHQASDENSPSSDQVWALQPDKSGNLWLGTSTGLDYFNRTTRQFSHFTFSPQNTQSINCANVLALLESTDGRIWIGTESGGVNIYNPKLNTFNYVTRTNGMPSTTVTSLVEDRLGFIWAGTINGLARINPTSLDVETLHERDGLAGDNITRNTLKLDRNGAIWVGSTSGLTQFIPEHINAPAPPPVIVLTQFSLAHQVQIPGAQNSVLNKSLESTQHIQLNHTQNSFSFTFSALSYISPKHNRFAYKLEGFDKTWNYVDNNQATYTNLDSGTYVFQVKAANSDNVWNETSANITLTIRPPAWRTHFAYGGYALIILGVVFMLLHRLKHQRALDKYKSLSTIDALTGIYNRAGIAAIVEGLFINSEMKQGVSLIMMDIDHFKRINDRRGHDAGDRILQDLVALINRNIRAGDHFARWGGEEFILLCPSTPIDNAKKLAEKLRLACANYLYEAGSAPLAVTLSIGLASCRPDDDFSLLLKRADTALYRAKNSGRNCIEIEE